MDNSVAIILGSNIHWAPYYYRYEKVLKELGIKFDLIFWNREGINERTSATYLHPENKAAGYSDIYDHFSIQGVAVKIIKDL